MPRYICKLNDHYFEWSTVVDDIVTDPMTLSDFKEYYKSEYGRNDYEITFDVRMRRVELKGTSSFDYDSVEELIPKKKLKKVLDWLKQKGI